MGYFKITLVGLVWLFCILTSVKGYYKIIIGLFAVIIPQLRSYALRVWVSDDQDIYTLVGGKNPDHTISGHVGWRSYQGKPQYKQAEKLINLLFWFDKNHCRKAIEGDEINQTLRY